MKEELTHLLNSCRDRLFFKINPQKACRFKISEIYKKNQYSLTFEDVVEYYACKTFLNLKKFEDFDDDREINKALEDSKLVLKAVKNMNLYGKQEKVYDYRKRLPK